MLWEQEMYTPFSYNKLTENFHFFASDVKTIIYIIFFDDINNDYKYNNLKKLGM